MGRPLADITTKMDYATLQDDLQTVLRTLHTVDREVNSRDGQWYMMRICPYRTTEDRIDGVVMTFMDMTSAKHANQALQRAREDLETKVGERTRELASANRSLTVEVDERRQAEVARLKLLSQIVTAQEDERRRLARDLHDHLGQQLTALRLKLETLRAQSDNGDHLSASVRELLEMTAKLDADIDFLAWEVRPAVLDDLGLVEALRNYIIQWCEHFKIRCEFHTSGLEVERPAQELENHLYRIAQEALNNVTKHSGASRVDVLLERRENYVVLIVEDNGSGFEPSNSTDTMGLTSMRERANLVGGEMEIESTPGKGTTIFVRLPLSAALIKRNNE